MLAREHELVVPIPTDQRGAKLLAGIVQNPSHAPGERRSRDEDVDVDRIERPAAVAVDHPERKPAVPERAKRGDERAFGMVWLLAWGSALRRLGGCRDHHL